MNLTQQMQLTQHPSLRVVSEAHPKTYGKRILRYFDKTPPTIVCPHFWELNWAYGCPFDCAYCYLQGTFRGNKEPKYVPVHRVLRVLDYAFNDEKFKPTIFNSGELADSLMNPLIMEKIADKFEKQDKHKLLLLTKSSNVKFLVERPRRQTIVSFSISASEVWKRWEKKTPSPEKRIEAARKVSEAGYEIRIRIDPIFPIENWQNCYAQLLDMLFSKLTPERITLGTPRGLAKTLMFSKDTSWANYFSEDSGWGKKLSTDLRKEICLFFHDRLLDLGFNRVSLCKETVSLWKQLEQEAKIFKSWGTRCNCVW